MAGEIRDLIYQDLATTLQSDFGQPLTITNIDGSLTGDFIGGTNDIDLTIDPLTGQFVSGRKINITVNIDDMLTTFSALPTKKWKVTLPQFEGKIFFVKDSMPDRTIGILGLVVGD